MKNVTKSQSLSINILKRKTDDISASFVVFLVALPLCMGISIASGVPPESGLITGIIGGLVVGFIAGSPLQISGPAAGLAVICWALVQKFGIEAFGLIVLLGGTIQLIAGILRIGQWFRAVPPSLVQGMLAGIGVLIFASQFYVMMDSTPLNSGVKNLINIPNLLIGLVPGPRHHMLAACTGIITILSIVVWNRLKFKIYKAIPAPLIGVVIGSIFANIFAPQIRFVEVPTDLIGSIQPLDFTLIMSVIDWDIIGAAVALAFIASIESLLCATAIDQMHSGVRTNYNKELAAQGIGNIICGFLNVLPMTGVIVRSKANIQSGGKSRLSAILHGVWILMLVSLFPTLLEMIPLATLAAILVYTGYNLINMAALRELSKYGRYEIAIYFITLSTIIATNLLIGVIAGFLLSLMKIALYSRSKLTIQVKENTTVNMIEIELSGAATFLSLPKLSKILEDIPTYLPVRIWTENLHYIDHACLNLIESVRKKGNNVVI